MQIHIYLYVPGTLSETNTLPLSHTATKWLDSKTLLLLELWDVLHITEVPLASVMESC